MNQESLSLQSMWGDTLRPSGLELTLKALDLCSFPPKAKIADLACGYGATLELLTGLGFEAVGLDLSTERLAAAAARGKVIQGDFHRLPWLDASFDGLICECSLSLAQDPVLVLRECFRVLKTKGRLIVSDLAGAGDELEKLLRQGGFEIRHHSDHSRALRELAAKLVWHLGSAEEVKKILGPDCREGHKQCGYSLIVAQKEGLASD